MFYPQSYFDEDDDEPPSNEPLYQPGPDSPTFTGSMQHFKLEMLYHHYKFFFFLNRC